MLVRWARGLFFLFFLFFSCSITKVWNTQLIILLLFQFDLLVALDDFVILVVPYRRTYLLKYGHLPQPDGHQSHYYLIEWDFQYDFDY